MRADCRARRSRVKRSEKGRKQHEEHAESHHRIGGNELHETRDENRNGDDIRAQQRREEADLYNGAV